MAKQHFFFKKTLMLIIGKMLKYIRSDDGQADNQLTRVQYVLHKCKNIYNLLLFVLMIGHLLPEN